MRAVRAEGRLVLQQPLVVDEALARAVLRELQADAGEFALAEIHHDGVLGRVEVVLEARGQRPVAAARVEALGAQSHAPHRHELVHALDVAARLHLVQRQRAIRDLAERAVAPALQVFALQLEVRVRGIAVGRPLHHAVGDDDARAAAELREGVELAVRVLLQRLVVGRGLQQRQAAAPRDAVADVAARVEGEGRHAGGVAAGVVTREAAAASRLEAEFHVCVGGREPVQLHAVVGVLRAQHGLVGDRIVDEVPGVAVLAVEVADAREEAPRLQHQPVGQRRRGDECFFGGDRVVAGDGQVDVAGQPGVDVGGERQLRLGEAEAARADADLGARRQREAGDAGLAGILRGVRIGARQDQRDLRVERTAAARGAGGRVAAGVDRGDGGGRDGRGRLGDGRRRRGGRGDRCGRVGGLGLGELGLGVVQLRFERTDALVVVGLHRGERLLEIGDVAGGRGEGRGLQADGQREGGDEAQRWERRGRRAGTGRTGGHGRISRLARVPARRARAGTGVVEAGHRGR